MFERLTQETVYEKNNNVIYPCMEIQRGEKNNEEEKRLALQGKYCITCSLNCALNKEFEIL